MWLTFGVKSKETQNEWDHETCTICSPKTVSTTYTMPSYSAKPSREPVDKRKLAIHGHLGSNKKSEAIIYKITVATLLSAMKTYEEVSHQNISCLKVQTDIS